MSRRRVLITALSATIGLAAISGCAGSGAADIGKVAADEGMAAAPEVGADEEGTMDPAVLEAIETDLLGPGGAARIDVDSDIVYREVDGELVLLDVCRSSEDQGEPDPRPAVMLIHGGGFHAGDKDRPQWQLICRWLADAGYVAVNLNYRLAPEYPFPAAIEDVQAAVEWARANAAAYGIDPERIGALGGSAGANLAQLLGTSGTGSTTEGSRVAAVVSLSGAADLTERALDLGEPLERQIRAVQSYLGCSDLTDCPASTDASPITHVDATDPPFLLAQSDRESLPVEQTEVMADALAEVGATPQVLIEPGTAHATRLLHDRPVRELVLDFLDQTLG